MDTEAYTEANDRERERLRALVERLDEDGLRRAVNEHWSVAGVLAHIAFWDARALMLARRLERGEMPSPADEEPEEVDWINDATRPLIEAIPPGEAASLALRLATETDAIVERLLRDGLLPGPGPGFANPLRADHRGEHLDEIEAALR